MYPSVNLRPLVLDWDDETVPPQVLDPIDLIVYAFGFQTAFKQLKMAHTAWRT